MKRLLLALAALLCSSAATLAPTVLRFPLPEGGIYEEWTIDVPRSAEPLDRVELDVRGYVRSYSLGYENLWPAQLFPFPSWGFLWADVRFNVYVDGDPKRAHVDWAWLFQATPRVAGNFDGALDYGGPSGVTMPTGFAATQGDPTEYAYPEAFEGAGTVPVWVVAPASFITFGSLSPAFSNSQHVFGGGELVVRLWPVAP